MNISLRPIDETNREAVLALSVREDQPFVATNRRSLEEAEETNAEHPGVARPFGIYAEDRLVGFCMFAFDPEAEEPDDRFWLWRFMIDKSEQDKGYGQAALRKIIQYFRENGADRLYLSTEPENERGLHIYHKAGFRETGAICEDEAVLMRMLKGPNKTVRDFYRVDVDRRMRISGKRGYGVSIAVFDGEDLDTYCAGSARSGQNFPVRPDTLFQAGSISKPAFAVTLLRYADKGLIDLDADISGVVPEYVKKGPMTFAALLSHTAGFNLHGFPGYPANHEPLSLEDVLNGKGRTPKLRRIRPFGKQYMYSGGGYVLAELAFTRLTGTTLREAFQKEVAEPLGLTRTGFFQPLDEELLSNAAFGGRLGFKEDPAHGYHYYPEHAAAGLWTTPTELVKLGRALSKSFREGGLLKKETALRMVTPVLDSDGLGIQNFRGDFGFHDGWNEGFVSSWLFSLREDLSVAVMYNRSTDELDWAQTNIAIELFQTIEEDAAGDADEAEWESFCGRYEPLAENYRLNEVFLEGGKLFARVLDEEGEAVHRLYPIGEKTFGRKGGFVKIVFGDGCLTIDETTCKKL
jgi:CubicO group peptidase (beta-lactamase class C family)/ribosomal protein S18 acetylase RimI-like enzyme